MLQTEAENCGFQPCKDLALVKVIGLNGPDLPRGLQGWVLGVSGRWLKAVTQASFNRVDDDYLANLALLYLRMQTAYLRFVRGESVWGCLGSSAALPSSVSRWTEVHQLQTRRHKFGRWLTGCNYWHRSMTEECPVLFFAFRPHSNQCR